MDIVETLSSIDWDKELDKHERKVCHIQAALFEFCQQEYKCDAFDFITKFMSSDFAADIDNNGSSYYSLNSFDYINSIRNKITIVPLSERKYTEALHWIGYLYRYWSWLGTPSNEIIQIVPVSKAYSVYRTFHTLDVMDAIGAFVERMVPTVRVY